MGVAGIVPSGTAVHIDRLAHCEPVRQASPMGRWFMWAMARLHNRAMALETESVSFAQTKIQPPRQRPGLIARTSLEQALGRALAGQRLTLLQAPAGWGKTAALTRQIAQLPPGTALAWVSVDTEDDLPRFVACLAAALEPLHLPWRVAPPSLARLAGVERGVRGVADELVNALHGSAAARGLIVIDDAHRLADARVFELLALLAERLPHPWGLVIASRSEPPLPLARLRARGELTEFRQPDLGFAEAEVRTLLAAHGASTVQAAELLARTGGWAAGLRLLLSVGAEGGRSWTQGTSQRHVFDHLADEVLAGMGAELRTFLLRCSVLPELTQERCADVSAMPQAAELLAVVERQGLFVSELQGREGALRLHDLFRDFLADRLRRDHADDLPGLLVRAAEREPDLARAVGWLAQAGDWDRAAARLAAHGQALLAAAGASTLERLLDRFPPAARARHPALQFLRGLVAYQRFDFVGLRDAMDAADTGFAAAGADEARAWARLYAVVGRMNTGQLASVQGALAQLRAEPHGPAVQAMEAYFDAWDAYANLRPRDVAPAYARHLQALEQVDDPRTWELAFFHSMLVGLPEMDGLVERFDQGATRRAVEGASVLRAGVLHARAARAFDAGRLDEAREGLRRAADDVQWLGEPRALLTEHLMLALFIEAAAGNRDAWRLAGERLRADLARSAVSNQRTHQGSILMAIARTAWTLGDDAALREMDRAIADARNPDEWLPAASEQALVQAMVALREGRAGDAEQALSDTRDVEDQCFWRSSQTLLLRAEAGRRQGALDRAARALAPWLALAHRGLRLGAPMLMGAPLMQALAGAAWGGRLTVDDVALLKRLAVAAAAPPAPVDDVRVGGLSARELEVLQCIAVGDSNKQIARTLDLSPLTVKRHVANILGKLDLPSRTHAAAWWAAHAERTASLPGD